MKSRQVAAGTQNLLNRLEPVSMGASRMRAPLRWSLLIFVAAILAPGVKAAISPDERPRFSTAESASETAQAEPVPKGGAVVPPVKREKPVTPTSQEPSAPASPPPAPVAQSKVPEPVPPPGYDGIMGAIQDWLARANREYQGVVVKQLSLPSGGPAEDAIGKKIEETKAEDAKKAAEDKRLAADRKAAEDTKRLADEAHKKAGDILKAEPAVKPPAPSAADTERIAAEKQAEDARRIEAQKLKAEQEAEEARRLQDEQIKVEARIAEERRLEQQRRAAEAERDKHRTRTIVLQPEPIPRPDAVGTVFRPELASADDDDRPRRVSYDREYRTGTQRGTAVKRWAWRQGGASCRLAGRRIVPPARYTVKRGDSLWRISARHHQNGRLYPRIYRANRSQIRDPDLIYPCQRVLVPRRH